VDHFDAGEDGLCICQRLEPEHGLDAALDASVILFDPVIEVLARTYPDQLQGPSRWIAQAQFSIARPDRLVIGLTAINDNGSGRPWRASALRRKRLAAGKSRCWQVSVLAEEERHRVADAVDGTI
jgi:hypothetical protein